MSLSIGIAYVSETTPHFAGPRPPCRWHGGKYFRAWSYTILLGRSPSCAGPVHPIFGGGNIQVTELNGFAVNLKMNTPTLIIVHQDVPGMIALVTDILSRYGINIAQMTVTRENAGEKAIMIIEIDSHQCDEAVTEIARIPHLHNVNFFS